MSDSNKLIFPLSLLQAAAANSEPTINPAKLSLDPVSKYEVANITPHYRQYFKYQNGKLQLLTPNFQCETLTVKERKPSDFSVLLPVGPWLRDQLNVIETFTRENVDTERLSTVLGSNSLVYKPLWTGNTMFVRVSMWCQVFRQDLETGRYDSVDIKTPLGKGTYNMTLSMPYVYIGPHKNGEDFSISTHVDQIVFIPEATRPTIMSFKAPETKGRRRKSVQPIQDVKA